MKKRLTATLLALALILSLVPAAFAADMAKASTQSVEVDGTKIEFQMYALVDANGGETNYVKLRDVAHVLNSTPAKFSVGYDGTISITTGEAYTDNGSEMTTPYSGDRAYKPGPGAVKVNGADVNLDAIVLTDDNGGAYTYFKLRDLGTALGFTVDWTGERGVFIETGAAPAPQETPVEEGPTIADFAGAWEDKYDQWVFTGDTVEHFSKSGDGTQIFYLCGTAVLKKDAVVAGSSYPYAIELRWTTEGTYGDTKPVEDGRTGHISIKKMDLANGVVTCPGIFVDETMRRVGASTIKAEWDKMVKQKESGESVYEFMSSYVQKNGYGSSTGRHSVFIPNNSSTNKKWKLYLERDDTTGELFLRAYLYVLDTGSISHLNSATYELTLSADGGPYQGTWKSHFSMESSKHGYYSGDSGSGTFTIDPASFSSETERLSIRGSNVNDFDDTNGVIVVWCALEDLRREILTPNGYTLSDLGFTNF